MSKCIHRKDKPTGYVERAAWFKKMSKTHIQKECKKCGLYHIWSRKLKGLTGKRNMERKKQCKGRFVFSTELNIVYLCIRKKEHKGRHHFVWQRHAKNGRILETRDFYAGEPKKYNPTYKTARWDIKVNIEN